MATGAPCALFSAGDNVYESDVKIDTLMPNGFATIERCSMEGLRAFTVGPTGTVG